MTTRYHLLICDINGRHEFIAAFESDTPFPAIAEGQRFDDHGWHRLRGVGVIASEADPIRYTVHSIKTTIFHKGNTLICQTGINVAPYHGERSPAFGNTQPTMTTAEALHESANKNT